MKVELSVIKYLLDYNNYKKYNTYIDIKWFNDELRFLYTVLQSYYAVNEESLTVQDFANLVFANNPKDKEYYEECLETIEQYIPVETTVETLIESLKQQKLLKDLSIAAYEVGEGKKSLDIVHNIYSQLTEKKQVINEQLFVTDDLEQLVNENVKQSGLRWRLQCLNQSVGSLRKGDFGFIFARPETGKTTFLASEVSHFLTQVDSPVLYFNNEEQGSKVMLRIYQAYFNVTLQELYGNINHYRKLFKEQCKDKLKLYDSAQINKTTVESLSKEFNPSFILFDQIDKLQGFKAERDDLLLGSIYQWARELAKQYCPVLGVTQADGSAEGVRWLTMGHVANAKTAKQAEADFILGIGKSHDAGWEHTRFINICKNKLTGDTDSIPELRHGKLTCIIDPERARYKDLV